MEQLAGSRTTIRPSACRPDGPTAVSMLFYIHIDHAQATHPTSPEQALCVLPRTALRVTQTARATHRTSLQASTDHVTSPPPYRTIQHHTTPHHIAPSIPINCLWTALLAPAAVRVALR